VLSQVWITEIISRREGGGDEARYAIRSYVGTCSTYRLRLKGHFLLFVRH
jgi:hypothetical protein